MQLKASEQVTIDFSEPELEALVSEEPDVIAEVTAFHAEIAQWAAEQARSFGARNASNELRRWSRRYFGAPEPVAATEGESSAASQNAA